MLTKFPEHSGRPNNDGTLGVYLVLALRSALLVTKSE